MTTDRMHPVDQLFAAMSTVKPYPAGVVPVPARIPGVAFFPGGAGLWGAKGGAPLPPMPVGGVMVVGQDFHSETAFTASLAQGTEVPDTPRDSYKIPPTWIGLRRLFKEAGIPLERCFFTNAFMGLRTGTGTTGRFPGSRDEGFVDRCQRFLHRQIDAQRPSVIVTLGLWVPRFIARLSPQLASWQAVASVKQLDAAGPVVHEVGFGNGALPPCTVVALTHPSLRDSNVRRRRYGGLEGHAAELRMLEEATRTAGSARPLV